jgi:hypothetical protein
MQVQSLTGLPGSLVGGVFPVGQELPVLVVARRMLQGLTRPWWPIRHGGLFGKLPSMRRRRAWARRLDRLLDAASRNPSARRFPHPDFEAPLQLSTRVIWACRLHGPGGVVAGAVEAPVGQVLDPAAQRGEVGRRRQGGSRTPKPAFEFL